MRGNLYFDAPGAESDSTACRTFIALFLHSFTLFTSSLAFTIAR